MNRRTALLAALSLPLSYVPVPASKQTAGPGHLTIDLSQWSGVTFKFQGQEHFIPSKEIFDALKEL